MKALNEILRKGEFKWGKEEEQAFQDVKNAYRDEQVLILHNPEKQTWLHADASADMNKHTLVSVQFL